MSDNSDTEMLPLPAGRDDGSDDSDSSSSSSSSSNSSVRTNEIPIPSDDPDHPSPEQNGCTNKRLDEIPIPEEHNLDLPEEVEIPLPPDSTKYSPSQATTEDDLGVSSSMEAKKAGPTVLGKAQAKKRLLAFSAAKLASSSPTTGTPPKKITPTKVPSAQKSSRQEQQLQIEVIKQEETKMKEILAMNTILNKKLMQVKDITNNLPITPPVTAIVKPTVMAASSAPKLPSLFDINPNISPIGIVTSEKEKLDKSPDRSRKSSKHIRKPSRSSSSSSKSHSRSQSSNSRSSSADKRTIKRGRKSRSRSRDKKEKDKKIKLIKEADKKKSRKSRSKSVERKQKRSHSRSKSKERDSDRRKKSRSRSKERAPDRHRHREKDSRARRSKSRSKDRDRREKDRRNNRQGSPYGKDDSRERSGRDRVSEKSKSDRNRRDEEGERRPEETKQLREQEGLDKVRLNRLPIDWTDFREHQYRFADVRMVRSKLSDARVGRRSQSGSPSPSRAQEALTASPLSKCLALDIKTISITGLNELKIEYPSFLVQKTKTEPNLSFGFTPLCSKGYYKSREKVFSEENSEIVDAMKEIINAKPSTKDSAIKTDSREWFSATPQAFCPAAGKQAVVISHLYSDEEKDESPLPTKNNSSSKPGKKSGNILPSPKVESMDEGEDSMDSAPSPLLKRKYEAPPSPSPPRPKKKSRRSPPPTESEEEIPLRKDDREPARNKNKTDKSKKRDDKEKREEVKEKKRDDSKDKRKDEAKSKRRADEVQDDDKDKKRIEKDKKREEKEKKREGKEKSRDEEKKSRDKDKTLERLEPDEKEKRKKKDDDDKKDVEKRSKREEKSKRHSEKERDGTPPLKEKSSTATAAKGKDDTEEKVKEKKKKKTKKKHKKRHESSSSFSSRKSRSPSASSSSSELSEDENGHTTKSKHKKLKKKKKAKAKKEKSKTRDKTPDSSDDRDRKDGGGPSGSRGGNWSHKDNYSRSRHDSRDRSRRDRSRERERDRDRDRRDRDRNYGRRRTGEDGVEFEDEEAMMTSPIVSFIGSEMDSDVLNLMNPPNPLSGIQLQLLDAQIDSILDSSKQTVTLVSVSEREPAEKSTHELLSAFDDDVLLQSVLQDENISAEKLLMNISTSDIEKHEPLSASLTQKPIVSWSDDSEEEQRQPGQTEGSSETATETSETVQSEPTTPTSFASTSGYETEPKIEPVTDKKEEEEEQHKREEEEREHEHSDREDSDRSGSDGRRDSHEHRSDRDHRDRDYNRRDYYDSRSRAFQAHGYDRRGGRRGGSHYDRYNDRRDSRDHDRVRRYGDRYYPSHRSSGSSHSYRYRDDRDRYSPDRDRRRRRYSDEEDRYGGRSEKHKEIQIQADREPGSTKTESPPVPDSTISDSELQSGNHSGNGQPIGTIDGAPINYADPNYYYHHAMAGIMGQEANGETGSGSPKRLSLDERLEIEMGLEKGQFLPKPEPNAPLSQIPIHHMNRLHSQINLMGSTIQIVPVDIPTAPIVIRSTYPIGTQFDVYGNPIGGPSQGQYPPRRVITIKVPVVPFTVPVVDREKLITKEAKIKRKRSSKLEKQKQKRKPSKLELERAKRKKAKAAEAKLARKLKHRESEKETSESHDEQKLAKDNTESEVADSQSEKTEPENEEIKDSAESGENATTDPGFSTNETPPEAVPPESGPAAEQMDIDNVVVKQEPDADAKSTVKTEETVSENVQNEPLSSLSPLKKIEILPAPDRGILVLLGFRDRSTEDRKKVKFADGIDPGCGTSSSGGEELASPPPSFGKDRKDAMIEAQLKKKIKRKKKKKKLLAEQTDLFAPPSCPKMPYPFCPPGILYQVCPQYAVLYAQAVAEKGLDVVFEPTDEVPEGTDKLELPAPVVQPQPNPNQSRQESTLNSHNNNVQSQMPLPSRPEPLALPAGIDFSQPPPSMHGAPPPGHDYTNVPPVQYSPYEHSPYPRHVEEPVPRHPQYAHPPPRHSYRNHTSTYTHPSQHNDNFYGPPVSRTPAESGSRIPTIVNHQPSPKVISPRSSQPPSSYSHEPQVHVGQSIEVLSRNSNPQPIYPVQEEIHHYIPPYNSSIPPPALVSRPQIEEMPPPSHNYHSTSNVLVPLHHGPPPLTPAPNISVPVRDTSVKRASKREHKHISTKTGKSDAGISIPLSKIISKSSIPSLAQNSPTYNRTQVPNHVSQQIPSPRNAYYSSYSSFEFSPYKTTPSTNLISVTPQPIAKTNLYEIPLTEVVTITAKPSPEKCDLNAVPTSTTSTPNSVSPMKINDNSTPSPASSATAFSA